MEDAIPSKEFQIVADASVGGANISATAVTSMLEDCGFSGSFDSSEESDAGTAVTDFSHGSLSKNADVASIDSSFSEGNHDVTFLEACMSCDINAVADKVKHGVPRKEVNAQDKAGRTALNHVCYYGYLTLLEMMVEIRDSVDVNLADNEGNTPLIMAAQAGHKETCRCLLENFNNIKVDQENNFGFTALLKSAIQGRTVCAKQLLDAGASISHRDLSRRMCAEEWARFCGRQECADLLAKLNQPKKGFKMSFKRVGPADDHHATDYNQCANREVAAETAVSTHNQKTSTNQAQPKETDRASDEDKACFCNCFPRRNKVRRDHKGVSSVQSLVDGSRFLSSPASPGIFNATLSSPPGTPHRHLDTFSWLDNFSSYSIASEHLQIPRLEVTSQDGETDSIQTGSNIIVHSIERDSILDSGL